jgi:hypothetical protein
MAALARLCGPASLDCGCHPRSGGAKHSLVIQQAPMEEHPLQFFRIAVPVNQPPESNMVVPLDNL